VPYLRILAGDAMGWPVFAAAVVGFGLALRSDWRRAAVLLVMPLTYLTFIAHTVPMSRYTDVILPMMAVAAGYAVIRGAALVRSETVPTGAWLAVLVALPGLLLSVRSNQFFAEDDTRALARAFVEREVPAGATILTQPQSAPVRMSRDGLVEALRTHLGDESSASIKFQLQLAVSPYPAPAYRLIYYGDGGEDVDRLYILPSDMENGDPLEVLRRRGIEYVILKRSHPPNPETAPLEAALGRDGRRLATFAPYRADGDPMTEHQVSPYFHNTATRIHPALERPGPIVDVWRIN
jgi:hypothetical protein